MFKILFIENEILKIKITVTITVQTFLRKKFDVIQAIQLHIYVKTEN